jgi:hypothetical protein
MEESSIAAVCQTKKPPTSRRRQEFGLPVKHLRPKPAAGSRQNSFIFVRKAGTPEAIRSSRALCGRLSGSRDGLSAFRKSFRGSFSLIQRSAIY